MEIAGIVIGGASLATLFDSCMNAFEYIDVGRRYGKDSQKAALKISVLELRLSRWSERVHFSYTNPTIPTGFTEASPKQSAQVAALLGQIEEDLLSSRKTTERYALFESDEIDQEPAGSAALESLGAKFRSMSLKRQNRASVRDKTLWALRDKKRLDGFIADITRNVDTLENVFPVLAQTSPQHIQAVIADVEELIQPSEVQEPDQASEPVISVLQEVTESVDDQLRKAIDKVVEKAAKGDSFQNIFTSDKAKLEIGDYIASDYKGPFIGQDRMTRSINNMQTTGEARVHIGTNHGGKYILDD